MRTSPQVACGRVAVLRHRTDPTRGITARLVCNRKACPACGPRKRAKLATHYAEAIGTTPVVRLLIARSAWAALAKRLRRAHGNYLRIPQPDGRFLVLATGIADAEVEDVRETLASAFAAMPNDTSRVTSSRAWAVLKPPGAGTGEREPEWELIGATPVTIAEVVEAAKELRLYQGRVPEQLLLPTWGEAHWLKLPPVGTLDYQRFARRVGLHWPGRRRRRQHAYARAA